jgi:hypothetical protein
MPDIMVLLACLSQGVEPTPLRQLGRVIEAMLSYERSGDHARPVTLVRQRRQLSDDPTFFQYQLALVSAQLAPHSPSGVGRR